MIMNNYEFHQAVRYLNNNERKKGNKIEQHFAIFSETPSELMSASSQFLFVLVLSFSNVAIGFKGNSQHLPLKLVIQHLKKRRILQF